MADNYLIEKRTKLDGGVNARAEHFAFSPDEALSVENFSLDRDGALVRREGGAISTALDVQGGVQNVRVLNLNITGSSATPLVAARVAASGAFAAGTYDFKYVLRIRSGGQFTGYTKVGPSLTITLAGVLLNDAVRISIPPTNKGDGLGQNTGLCDDPFMGGYVSGEVEIYAKKSTDPSLTLQAGGAVTFTWDGTNRRYTYLLTAYTSNGAVVAGLLEGQSQIRTIKYWPEFCRLYVLTMDSLWCMPVKRYLFPSAILGDLDKTGFKICVSRLPTPLSMAFVSRVPIFTDGFRSKKINDTSTTVVTEGSGTFRMLGANPPDGTPTLTNVAVGVLNGTYFYKISFIYQHARAVAYPTPVASSGIENWSSESNPSTVSASITVVNRTVRVTFNSTRTETGLLSIRVYRTVASGTTFYKVADVAAANSTYDDNTPDSGLDLLTTPADDVGKAPCDLPPNQILHLTEFQGYAFGVVGSQIVSYGDDRVCGFVGTNVARLSKYMLQSSPSIQATVDHWPNTIDYTVVCGSTSRINGLANHRGNLYVFKEDEVGVIVGDGPGTYFYRTITSGIGALPNSVVIAGGSIFFWHSVEGGQRFDGASIEPVGDKFQNAWEVDRDAGYWCYNTLFDQVKNRIRWFFTTMPTDPDSSQIALGQGNADTIRGLWKEYVFQIRTNAWSVFTSSGTSRNITAAALIDTPQNANVSTDVNTSAKKALFGNTEGRMVYDYDAQTDLSSTAIAAAVEFPSFFGSLEFVKEWRQLFTTFTMALDTARTAGVITFKVKFAEDSAFSTIATWSTTPVGYKCLVTDIPKQPTGNISADRGMSVRIESTLDCDLTLVGLFARWKDGYAGAKAVR